MKVRDHEGATPRDLSPGTRFGNYEIVRKLGQGGMGAVYEARRRGLDKRVALKVLTVDGMPSVTSRFLQEARIGASMDHPNIAECLDIGEHDGMPYLTLEFLEGETLGSRLKRGPMSVTEVVDVLLPVCSALLHIHERGITHRDLKPDNIFLARKVGMTVPKLLDFGIAKAERPADAQKLTRTASMIGTPGYMSPEQAQDSSRVVPTSDQFSLGAILWEALAGRALFQHESSFEVICKTVKEEAPPLRTAVPSTPEALEATVARLLQKDPAQRYPSMREVGDALQPFASGPVRQHWANVVAPPSPLPTSTRAAFDETGPTPLAFTPASAPVPAPSSSRLALYASLGGLFALLSALIVLRTRTPHPTAPTRPTTLPEAHPTAPTALTTHATPTTVTEARPPTPQAPVTPVAAPLPQATIAPIHHPPSGESHRPCRLGHHCHPPGAQSHPSSMIAQPPPSTDNEILPAVR